MHLELSSDMLEFRDEARQWLTEHVPTERRPPDATEARVFDAEWQAAQYRGGWAGVSWPEESGGRGLSPAQQIIWYEECVRAGAPLYSCFMTALGHAGPTLITRGDPGQQDQHLEPILRGEHVWSQGFSEPGAGSDLASLRTSAELVGDYLVVNGSKIWTSHAHVSDFQELLVRTSPDAQKHKGITWVICDMRSPGLEIRPIPTLDGHTHYSQVFYDDVQIPLSNVVGGLDNGWSVAMATLQFERGIGFLLLRLGELGIVDDLIEQAETRGMLSAGSLAGELAQVRAEAVAVRALGYDAISGASHPLLVTAVNQILHGDLAQRIGRLGLRILGPESLQAGGVAESWLASFRLSITGGTRDIQKNILATRVMELPR